jgi:hypothetical protein
VTRPPPSVLAGALTAGDRSSPLGLSYDIDSHARTEEKTSRGAIMAHLGGRGRAGSPRSSPAGCDRGGRVSVHDRASAFSRSTYRPGERGTAARGWCATRSPRSGASTEAKVRGRNRVELLSRSRRLAFTDCSSDRGSCAKHARSRYRH